MKTILIATDFSAASNKALLLAAEYAKAFKARLIVYHAFRIIYTNNILVPPAVLQQNCKEELQNKLKELQGSFDNNIDVIVEEVINIADAILHVAEEKKAAVIFLGMNKRGRAMRKLFGSTASKLSHQSEIPLIIVPEEAHVILPKRIVLANDISKGTDMTILNLLREVVEKFQSKLFVARIIKTVRDVNEEKVTSSKMSYHLADLKPDLVYLWDENVNHGLEELLKENKADMLAIISHHHNFFEKLFEGSKTDHMLSHSQIPVLILPDRNSLVTVKAPYETSLFDESIN